MKAKNLLLQIFIILFFTNYINAQIAECDSYIWYNDTLDQSGEYSSIELDMVPYGIIEGQYDSVNLGGTTSYYENQLGQDVKLTDDGLHLICGGNLVKHNNLEGSGEVRVFSFDGQNWNLKGDIIINPDSTGFNFGISTAITPDGNTIAISDIKGNSYVFNFVDGQWVQVGSALNLGSVEITNWGSIDISDDGQVVAFGNASKFDGDNTFKGRARVYQFDGDDWIQKGTDFIGQENETLGLRVRLSADGNRLFIASPFFYQYTFSPLGNSPGQIKAYEFTNDTWVQLGQTIFGDNIGDAFGHGLDINSSGDVVIIGAPNNTGMAKVYNLMWMMGPPEPFTSIPTFVQQWVQYGQTIYGETNNNFFGTTVTLADNGTIAVGEIKVNNWAGRVSHYHLDPNPVSGGWKLTSSPINDSHANNYLGWSIDLTSDGTKLATAASGWEPIEWSSTYRKIGILKTYDLMFDTLNLTILNTTYSTTTISNCDSLIWNDSTYFQSGTYLKTITNAVGCDSVMTLNLTINNATESTNYVTVCDSLVWNDSTYYNSGVYNFYTTNSLGCDSTAILYLTINQTSEITSNISSCSPYQWNDSTYSQSGTYIHVFNEPNSNGCDSVSVLNLTMLDPNDLVTDVQACDSYSWNDSTYFVSGTYTNSSSNSDDCVAVLNLTINNSTSSTTNFSTCEEEYTWNGSTFYQSGTYFNITTNNDGCPNIDTLNLSFYDYPELQSILGETEPKQGYIYTYELEQNSNNYEWSVYNGDIITIDNNKIEVSWNDLGFGSVEAKEINSIGCFVYHSLFVNVNIQGVFGCIDTNACNFNPLATIDDGSCYEQIYASIHQSADTLVALVSPSDIPASVNWYNYKKSWDFDVFWRGVPSNQIFLMAENTMSFTPMFDCTYFIIATVGNCTDTTELYNFSEEAKSIGQLSTFPNPTNGKVKVQFENEKRQFVRLFLTNNSGQVLNQFTTYDNYIDLDLSQYPQGSYHISFKSPESKACSNENIFEKNSNSIILNK